MTASLCGSLGRVPKQKKKPAYQFIWRAGLVRVPRRLMRLQLSAHTRVPPRQQFAVGATTRREREKQAHQRRQYRWRFPSSSKILRFMISQFCNYAAEALRRVAGDQGGTVLIGSPILELTAGTGNNRLTDATPPYTVSSCRRFVATSGCLGPDGSE
jgi:hypothetical protein